MPSTMRKSTNGLFDSGQPALGSAPIERLSGRQRREPRKKALWLGYPVLLRHARGRNWISGNVAGTITDLATGPGCGQLGFLPEPQINTRALEGLAASANPLEEASNLTDELGIEAAEPPPLDELVARLRELRPEWEWREPLAPAQFRGFGELRSITLNGIYNAAVVVIADRSPFTVGLERELADLQRIDGDAIRGSSLGTLLGARAASVANDGPILEPAPLNAEQRTAVRQALSEPLTVITGPPGTGKSQVVSAILVNAAWRGLRVLFASKNNKAVDVVMERVNALSPGPVMLRLGARALQQQLAQHITTILSSCPTEHDRRAYQSATGRLEVANRAFDALMTQIHGLMELRNRVDRLEQAAKSARSVLSPEAFAGAQGISLEVADTRAADLREAIRRSDRGTARFFETLFWPLQKAARDRHLQISESGFIAALAPFGFARPPNSTAQQIMQDGTRYLDALRSASEYNAALGRLIATPDTGTLATRVADHNRVLAQISGEVWKHWTALLPDRLTEQDRSALGDYAAVLRIITGAEGDGGAIAKHVWRRYYELAPRTTKALPCWSVTSLSARGRVPFAPATFDLLVIDEASQCDIASAVPLLFRARRAVIIGDPQQLRHISRLSDQRDQALMVKHGILDEPGPNWSYRANGLYDLAAAKAKAGSIVVLRDHHRSHADIIGFSNEFFYRGQLRVATDYRRLKRPAGPVVRWVDVTGNVVRPPAGSAVNHAEAAAVIEELRRIAIVQRFTGEIGVVTPFLAQKNLIGELVARDASLASALAARNFMCETAHNFQGDERDLMLFSPVVSRGTPAGATAFLKSQGNIFNVGITRARSALVVVGDAAACLSSGIGYLSAFARYVAERGTAAQELVERAVAPETGSDYPTVTHPERVSQWERSFYSALVQAGFRTIPQYDVDQYRPRPCTAAPEWQAIGH